MQNRTHRQTTHKPKRFSRLDIEGRDPNMDYAFCRRRDVEEGGGVTHTGYEPISAHNHSGEHWGGPKIFKHRQGAKQFINQDTILCKRPKEVTKYFKEEEIEKRNHQIKFINSVARNARRRLQELDPGSVVVDRNKGGRVFTQRTGPTEETEEA